MKIATEDIWTESPESGTRLLLLLAIARETQPDGAFVLKGTDSLCRWAKLCRAETRHVKRMFQEFVEKGYLEEDEYYTKKLCGDLQGTVYKMKTQYAISTYDYNKAFVSPSERKRIELERGGEVA